MKRILIRFGFIFIFIFIGIIVSYFLFSIDKDSSKPNPLASNVNWEYDQETKVWIAEGKPPECMSPIIISSPVDVGLVSGILYPGQFRGSDYKPHGAFRFDHLNSNKVEVRAIMDGKLIKASKYLQGGEEQILFFYINDCGIMISHDHILKPSEKIEKALETIPVGKEGDSRTTFLDTPLVLEKGDLIAEEVGFKNFEGSKNIFVDFGLYDLRNTNGINYKESFIRGNQGVQEFGLYALCWLEYLSSEDKLFLENLPIGGQEVKISDYCI